MRESEKLAGQFVPDEIARSVAPSNLLFGYQQVAVGDTFRCVELKFGLLVCARVCAWLGQKHQRLLSISEVYCTLETQRLHAALFAHRFRKRPLKRPGIGINQICICRRHQRDHHRQARLDLHTDLLSIPFGRQDRVDLRRGCNFVFFFYKARPLEPWLFAVCTQSQR